MGQDFTKGLNVCIGNYGYYNEGSLHDAWITLPKTEAEIRDFLSISTNCRIHSMRKSISLIMMAFPSARGCSLTSFAISRT